MVDGLVKGASQPFESGSVPEWMLVGHSMVLQGTVKRALVQDAEALSPVSLRPVQQTCPIRATPSGTLFVVGSSTLSGSRAHAHVQGSRAFTSVT